MWDPGQEPLTCGEAMETCDTSACGGDADVKQEDACDGKESFTEHHSNTNSV